jgi:hypothetical protein
MRHGEQCQRNTEQLRVAEEEAVNQDRGYLTKETGDNCLSDLEEVGNKR